MIGRTNAGGGGGLQDTDALLRVQAPAGSVVTITKGATTKTDHGHENADDHTVYDYYFIIHQSQFDSVNPWVVTAVSADQSQTKSDNIIIDAADEYDVVLTYRQYYYNLGDVMTSVTGGYSRTGTAGTLTLNADNMQWIAGSNIERFAASENAVDLTSYNTLYFNVYCNSSYSKRVGIASSRGSTFVSSVTLSQGSAYTLVSIDISSLSGSFYIMFTNGSSNAAGATYINAIYAE